MHTAPISSARNARCMASLDAPGTVEIELPRGDGRIVPLQLTHQEAAALAHRLGLQAKLAELFEQGQKLRGKANV